MPAAEGRGAEVMPGGLSDRAQWRHANPTLDVADVPAAMEYYRTVFGLLPAWMAPEENIGGVSTETTPIELYLERVESPIPSRISVFVDDADGALANCKAAGADIAEEIETKPWGVRRFTVRDPDRNLIDISHEVNEPRGEP
jgi:predicted enzyme related to lactoylglutathione lyase